MSGGDGWYCWSNGVGLSGLWRLEGSHDCDCVVFLCGCGELREEEESQAASGVSDVFKASAHEAKRGGKNDSHVAGRNGRHASQWKGADISTRTKTLRPVAQTIHILSSTVGTSKCRCLFVVLETAPSLCAPHSSRLHLHHIATCATLRFPRDCTRRGFRHQL